MIYKVIGLMSGSSLDGLDIVYTTITNVGNNWEYEIEQAATVDYPDAWQEKLSSFKDCTLPEFLELHTAYGRYLGEEINQFITQHHLHHKVHFVVSHGHTVYHNPQNKTTFQLGDGAGIAATTGLTVIAGLRNMDMAYGGQGAPIVPIADQLLFGAYRYCLNLGGIANISIKTATGIVSSDICAANQVLNHFAQLEQLPFDNKGILAASGSLDGKALEQLQALPFFQQQGAKSLSNDFSQNEIIPLLEHLSPGDALHTACKHIAAEVKRTVLNYPVAVAPTQVLVTGGGAHNDFLMESLRDVLHELKIELVKPDDEIINFKEAVAMALIGVLRWREETNVLCSATGASQDSIGGAIWLAN